MNQSQNRPKSVIFAKNTQSIMPDLLKLIVCGSAAIGMALSASAERNPQAVKDLLDRIGGTGTSSKIETELDASLADGGKETFV
ncbi:MAG: hypothetical protein K2L71_00485, partial [Muribaculaceae bacterium]|nr:hypothetical protein [Muribaculaceae bacterium]